MASSKLTASKERNRVRCPYLLDPVATNDNSTNIATAKLVSCKSKGTHFPREMDEFTAALLAASDARTASHGRASGSGRNGGRLGIARRHAGRGRGRGRSRGREGHWHQERDAAGRTGRGEGTRYNDAVEDFDAKAICGRLIHEACRKAAEGTTRVPDSFATAAEYVNIFSGFVLSEARASVRASYAEACDAGAVTEVRLEALEDDGQGWYKLVLTGTEDLTGTREGAVVILTSTCPPQRGVDDWLSNSGEKRGKTENIRATKRPRVEQDGDATSAVAGLLHSKYRFGGVEDGHHVWEISLHPGCGREAACGQLCLQVIQDLKQGLASEHRVGAKWWMGSGGLLVPQVRELSALSAVSTMPLRGILLRPQQLRYFSSGCWPSGFHSPQFHDYLRASFDEVQLKAIEECVGFLGAEGEGRRARPVTLIQGPPGTGKTHTIRGVLNTWHLLQYQRHYASVDACILGTMQLSAADWDRDTLDMLETRLEAGEGVLPLPKILVCAPSNGATDELLRRVLEEGFVDLNGTKYAPKVLRIGAADSSKISQHSHGVFVDKVIDGLLAMEQRQREDELSKISAFLQDLTRSIASLKSRLVHGSADARRTAASQLSRELHRREKYLLRMEILECAGGAGTESQGGQKERLEVLLMKDAEIVFTTLSSSGRTIVSRSGLQFRTVLVDEACQASEPATLQALAMACEHCVLVGDPQQLPATVLSIEGRDKRFERSLFERLMDGGCPVHLLAVQYRMHPEIRAFPGDFFYDARLKDGFCVLNASDEPFYKHPDLGPYRFFDVSFGTESRSASKSVSNTAEVSVVASLVLELLATLNGGAGSAHVFHRPYQVTVITPYRAQLSLLRRTLGKLRINVSLISPLTFETVDSFQGKQADIIILSCVRTLPGAVGFVSDVRRLNVAITRAKRALWIVGNAYALATSSDVWQKLVEDAKARGHFCHTPEDIVQVHKPLVS